MRKRTHRQKARKSAPNKAKLMKTRGGVVPKPRVRKKRKK